MSRPSPTTRQAVLDMLQERLEQAVSQGLGREAHALSDIMDRLDSLAWPDLMEGLAGDAEEQAMRDILIADLMAALSRGHAEEG